MTGRDTTPGINQRDQTSADLEPFNREASRTSRATTFYSFIVYLKRVILGLALGPSLDGFLERCHCS